MQDRAELEDAVGRAEVYSHAALKLLQRFLIFLSARDPALIQAFAEAVASTQYSPTPGADLDAQDLEEAALGLERQVATAVLAQLRTVGARPQH